MTPRSTSQVRYSDLIHVFGGRDDDGHQGDGVHEQPGEKIAYLLAAARCISHRLCAIIRLAQVPPQAKCALGTKYLVLKTGRRFGAPSEQMSQISPRKYRPAQMFPGGEIYLG